MCHGDHGPGWKQRWEKWQEFTRLQAQIVEGTKRYLASLEWGKLAGEQGRYRLWKGPGPPPTQREQRNAVSACEPAQGTVRADPHLPVAKATTTAVRSTRRRQLLP
jgi:hypothetical protein